MKNLHDCFQLCPRDDAGSWCLQAYLGGLAFIMETNIQNGPSCQFIALHPIPPCSNVFKGKGREMVGYNSFSCL